MPYQMFHDLYPALAERETRCITVTSRAKLDLPTGDYFFHEMYCNDQGCDCRRVFFFVVSSVRKDVEAVVAWGWEKPAFYEKWLGDDKLNDKLDLKGPSLNLMSPQTALAPALLNLAQNLLLRDPDYVARIKRHYRLFRDKIDGKSRGKSKRGAAIQRTALGSVKTSMKKLTAESAEYAEKKRKENRSRAGKRKQNDNSPSIENMKFRQEKN